MFAAGYLPGFLCMVFQMLVCWIICKKHGYGVKTAEEKAALKKGVLKLFVVAIPVRLIPLGIMMALRGGAFTATEAETILCFYSILIGALVYRKLKWEHVIPNLLAGFILESEMGKWSFLLLVNIILLLLGMVMSGTGPTLVLGPVLTPIAVKLGIDAIQFGLMLVFNLGIGNMTPPFGIVLYQVGGLLEVPLPRLVKASLPFLGVMLFVLLLINLFPPITTFIPNLLYSP